MKFKKLLKSADDESRHVFGLSDSDVVLIANLISAEIQLAEMGAKEISDEMHVQLQSIMNELSVAIAEDEKTNA